MADFSSYSILISAFGMIRARSPVRIGAGKSLSIMESDLPVVKNSNGKPVIPGSSLKGFFRGQLQKILLMKMQNREVDRLLKEIFGGTEENDRASAIFFHEMEMQEGRIAERKHIAIDPEKGSVKNLFEVECVMDGAVFKGRILSARNLNPKALGLLKTVIDLSNLGLGRLGGFKSRGYGEVEIKVDEIRLIFPGKDMEDCKRGFEVSNLVPENFGPIRAKAADSELFIDSEKFRAEIGENRSFFGLEAKISGEEVIKFLNSMLKLVKL